MRMLWRGRGRHRVEGFARGVEDGVEPCSDDPSTSRLVGLANALRSMPLRPSPELTLAFRRRIVNAARASSPEEPRSLLGSLFDGLRLKRGLASTTALLTAAVALASIGFGTTQALPGDTLYGLKLRGESITIVLARSDEAKGYNYLRFAGARLRDVSGLLDHDGAWRETAVTSADREPSRHLAGLVNSTLTTMNGYTDKGASSLRRAYQRTGDPAPLAYLDDFTKKQHRALSGMLGKLPEASQAVAGASLNLVDRLAREASKLLTEQCNHALACQSQPRLPEETASSTSPTATPTEGPATSVASNIQTSGTPDPASQPGTRGTTPQRVPSTSEQPPSTTTPTDPGSSGGSSPSSSPTTPPSTGDGSDDSGGSSGDSSSSGSSSGADTTDSASSQSPPQPTGVPATSSERATDSSSSPSGSTGSWESAPAGDDSRTGSDGAGGSGDTSGSGGTGGSESTDSGSGEANTPASRQSTPPSDPAGTTASEPSSGSDASGAPPDRTPGDRPAAGSSTETAPAP